MRELTLDLLTRAGGDGCKRRLDVGCGTGLFLDNWRRRGKAERLTGVDFAYPALEFARQRTEAEWVTGSAAALPLQEPEQLAHPGLVAQNSRAALSTIETVKFFSQAKWIDRLHDVVMLAALFRFEASRSRNSFSRSLITALRTGASALVEPARP